MKIQVQMKDWLDDITIECSDWKIVEGFMIFLDRNEKITHGIRCDEMKFFIKVED